MKFVTIAGPDSGEFSGKPVMLNTDVQAWVAAGKPPLNNKQLGALCRTLAYQTGRDPETLVALAKTTRKASLLSRPRTPKQLKRALAVGEPITPSDVPRMMAKATPELRELYEQQQAPRTPGIDPEESKIMLAADVDPGLRAMWLSRLGSETRPPDEDTAPLGMDTARYALHRAARQLADARCLANAQLDPGEAYILASREIADRENPSVI